MRIESCKTYSRVHRRSYHMPHHYREGKGGLRINSGPNCQQDQSSSELCDHSKLSMTCLYNHEGWCLDGEENQKDHSPIFQVILRRLWEEVVEFYR